MRVSVKLEVGLLMGQGQVGIIREIPQYLISQAKKPGRLGLPGSMTLPLTVGGAKKNGLIFCCLKCKVAAGDYVFDELSKEESPFYKELIKCLKRCFCKVKSTKTYAAIFWKCYQKALKSEEIYVTELKRVYGKAYPLHDSTF